MVDLGERIKRLRQRDGRTQEELANKLGVTGQAVSRWEKGICYPDMELLPSIANYFNTSIDELFGYDNERSVRLENLINKIREMNMQNNGVDVNIDECIELARNALVEFPGNEKLTIELASVLYNAGYVRHGEYHLKDDEGFDVYDIERHRKYSEWQEAIKLYEKVLPSVTDMSDKSKVLIELSQLYRNTGESDKAIALANESVDLSISRQFLAINAHDGKEAVKASQEALLETVNKSVELIQSIVLSDGNMKANEAADLLKRAMNLFEIICPMHDYGKYDRLLAHISLLRSYYLWLAEERDEAFVALDEALEHAECYMETSEMKKHEHSSELVKYASIDPAELNDALVKKELPDVWPWWSVDQQERVKKEMQQDPRWQKWEEKTKA